MNQDQIQALLDQLASYALDAVGALVILLVGWWIAGDADARAIPRWSQAGILLATLMAGPLGLAIYLFYRATRPGMETDDAAG